MDTTTAFANIKRSLDALHQRSDNTSKAKFATALIMRAGADLARTAGNVALAQRLEQRAAVLPAQTTVPDWAGDLARSDGGQLILMAMARSAFAQVLARSNQISLLGPTQQRVSVLDTPAAAELVDEGQPIPHMDGSLTRLPVSPKKLAAIVGFTSEMAKRSNIAVVARVLLTSSFGRGIDAISLTDQPPFGVLQGITPTAAGATPLEDAGALIAAIDDPSTGATFIMHPSKLPAFLASTGQLFPYPTSSSIYAGDRLILVDPLGLAGGIGEAELAVSRQALAHEDDVPLPISAGAVTASPVRSYYQTDSMALRGIVDVAWTTRPNSVAFVSAVGW